MGLSVDTQFDPPTVEGITVSEMTKGEVRIWLEPRVVDKLTALRGKGESYSDVILRPARGDAGATR